MKPIDYEPFQGSPHPLREGRDPTSQIHLLLLLLGLTFVLPLGVLAHEGPEETVQHLTEHMKQSGPTARLLYRRASEYRALGQLLLAAKDLEQAVALKKNSIPALSELSQVYLALNRPADALRQIDRVLQLDVREGERSGFQIIRARVLHALERNEDALLACTTAFDDVSPDPDRYLLRSEIHASLDRQDDRVRGLKEGFDKTGSAVLEEEWIEAMIDARQFKAAILPIEEHLNRSRWRSSWLLRRARVRQGLGSEEAARKDLTDAIEEINQRLNPRQPDLFLLADRGLSYALLGNKQAAGEDLALAQATGAQQWVVQRLKRALE